MGKLQISNDLQKRRTTSSLLAVSLAASIAAFGCTTNLNPGNGTPTRSGPELRSAPTSGVTSGSETVAPPPKPMTSSYTRAEMLPTVSKRTITRRSPEEAAAIMAGRQVLRGRYLGPANPGPGNRPYVSDSAGGFVNPAMLTNPQLTINSTISSPSTTGIGNDGLVATGVVNTTATGTTAIDTTAVATVAGTTTGTVTTGTGVGLPAGTFASVRPATTESISNNPSVTTASLGAGRSGTTVSGTAATTTTTAAATTVTNATSANTTSVTGGVRIVRGTEGAVTITNASSGSNQQ